LTRLNAVAGVHFKNGLLFTVGYGYGFKFFLYKGSYSINIGNANSSPGGVQNNVASISIGYAFL